MIMDSLNKFFSTTHRERQLELLSSCLLMAGALKRHNEDAAVVLDDGFFQEEAEDLARVMSGADRLFTSLSQGCDLDPIEENELNMMWNKLRHQVSEIYQPKVTETGSYKITQQIEDSLSRINQRHH
jgi:hypothetical protein